MGQKTIEKQVLAAVGGRLDRYEAATWRWQQVMGRPQTKTAGRALAALDRAALHEALLLWQRRALAARREAQHPPHLRQFLCIHRYEGSWTAGGGPYYGGLQMDLGFQSHYGYRLLHLKGTADHWTPLEQIWVAERAYREGRGYWPWPNTARFCGLL
ncbi:MAG: lysozyme family protein [Gaiellaceae bacterium]